MKPVCVDFETFGIEQRPDYPPKPVGVSIKYPGKKAHYYAFGHPSENNCTKAEAQDALHSAWLHPGGVLFHNAKFDVDVAETHMGMPRLHWSRMHDTMFMLFLEDPDAPTFSLKPSAERLLSMAPEERDAVRDWLVEHKVVSKSSSKWGAFIAHAPGDVVGRYADGDVIRTEKLFNLLLPRLKKAGMLKAYDRERQLMPILLDNERRGIRVDTPRLCNDVAFYGKLAVQIDTWIRKRLKSKSLNIDSGADLLEALRTCGKINDALVGKTPKMADRTDKETIQAAVTDKVLAAMLLYRASLQTCLKTFLQPWLASAERCGRIFTSWNQVRTVRGSHAAGAVTGRLSSTPNFQNIPNEFSDFFKGLTAPFEIPDLPLCRQYIIPDEGYTLVGRDYSQQELRVLAHFAGGALLEAYLEDPRIDIHDHATRMMAQFLGWDISDPAEFKLRRKGVKNTGFGLIYGMGVAKLGVKSGITTDEARELKSNYLSMFPELRELNADLKRRAAAGEPYFTWGKRRYFCEPATIEGDEVRTYEYKMINRLVQGSSADCTKQAIINFDRECGNAFDLLLTVHDEVLIQVPSDFVEEGHQLLDFCMQDVAFQVPMLSDGKTSTTNWSEMKPHAF